MYLYSGDALLVGPGQVYLQANSEYSVGLMLHLDGPEKHSSAKSKDRQNDPMSEHTAVSEKQQTFEELRDMTRDVSIWKRLDSLTYPAGTSSGDGMS